MHSQYFTTLGGKRKGFNCGFNTYEGSNRSAKHAVDHNAQHFNHSEDYLEKKNTGRRVENGPPESMWDALVLTIGEDNAIARHKYFHWYHNRVRLSRFMMK